MVEVDGTCRDRHVDRFAGICRSIYECQRSAEARLSERYRLRRGPGRPRLEGAVGRERCRFLLLRPCDRQAPFHRLYGRSRTRRPRPTRRHPGLQGILRWRGQRRQLAAAIRRQEQPQRGAGQRRYSKHFRRYAVIDPPDRRREKGFGLSCKSLPLICGGPGRCPEHLQPRRSHTIAPAQSSFRRTATSARHPTGREPDTTRLKSAFRVALYGIFALLFVSGVVWLLADKMKYDAEADTEMWQQTASFLLTLHGGAAMVTLMLL